MKTKTIHIGNTPVGFDFKPLIIAEMSGNHNQSLDRALAIVDAAADAGAHAIKLQTYTPDTMTIEGVHTIEDPNSLWKNRELYDLYREAYTPWEWHQAIFARAHERGILAFSSPFDETAVDFLETLQVPAYKIASFENTDLPLLQKVAATGKPVIVSTGVATVAEVDEAVRTLKAHGCHEIILLKCTSTYPASPENTNLRTIPHLAQLFDLPVGLSDHTMGVGASVAAVALGACVIEKHFTLRRADGGVDSAFSLEPQELKMLVEESERAFLALGNIQYGVQKAETNSRLYKRSIYVSRDVQPGEKFSKENLRVIRPNNGLEPKYLDQVLGKTAKTTIKAGNALNLGIALMRFKRLVQIYADILHLRFTDTFAHLPAHAINAISPVSVFARLGRVLGYTAGRLLLNLFLLLNNKERITGKIWLYVVNKNNYESLHFIQEQLPEAVMVAGQSKEIGMYNRKVNRLPTRFKLFYYYKFPWLLWGLYRLKGKRALRFYDLIYTATGYYELSVKYLKKYRPQAIIFANDHNTDSRALLLAAKEVGVPTIYIQHASVSTSFPPHVFDLNLLEGQDSFEKYKACGPITGEVKFIGMPKADKYLAQKNLYTTINNIGVSANIIDELDAIKQLLTCLVQKFPDKNITFRPHPSDQRNFSFIEKISTSIQFSDAKTEPAFDFLTQQDALIAADSSIHLEAVMLNVLSIYYRLEKSRFIHDYYGYVRHNLVEKAANLNELVELLRKYEQNRPAVYERARYYNAVMGTAYEGRSHKLAMRYINEFLSKVH